MHGPAGMAGPFFNDYKPARQLLKFFAAQEIYIFTPLVKCKAKHK
jgi:adenylylsulfate kinase-like enzyme